MEINHVSPGLSAAKLFSGIFESGAVFADNSWVEIHRWLEAVFTAE